MVSKEALLKAGKKLPIKVGFVDRNNVGDITFNNKFVDSLKGKGKAKKSKKIGMQKRGYTSSSAAVVQQVFNRQHKMLQRDAAANARFDLIDFDDEGSSQSEAVEQRDFEYLRDEVADRLVSRLDYINRDFLKCWTLDRALAAYFGRFRQTTIAM